MTEQSESTYFTADQRSYTKETHNPKYQTNGYSNLTPKKKSDKETIGTIERFEMLEKTRKKKLQKRQENEFKSTDIPLFDRSQKDLKQKQVWLQKQQEMKKRQEQIREMEGVTFHPKISESAKQMFEGRKRTADEFYKYNLKWTKRKEQTILQLQRQKDKELESKSPFKPTTNHEKQFRFEKNFLDRQNEMQLRKELKIKQIKEDIRPSFTPETNPQTRIKSKFRQVEQLLKYDFNDQVPFYETSPKKSFEFFEQARRQFNRIDYQRQEEAEQKLKQLQFTAHNGEVEDPSRFMKNTDGVQRFLQQYERIPSERINPQYQSILQKVQVKQVASKPNQMVREPSFGSFSGSFINQEQVESQNDSEMFGQQQQVPRNSENALKRFEEDVYDAMATDPNLKRKYFNFQMAQITDNISNLMKEQEAKRRQQEHQLQLMGRSEDEFGELANELKDLVVRYQY